MELSLSLPFEGTPSTLGSIAAKGRYSVIGIKAGDFTVTINVNDIKAGDVVAFSAIRSGFVPFFVDPIISYQKAVLAAEHATWSHVGIIDQNFIVWDAMPQANVRRRPLAEVLREKRVIRILRPYVEIDAGMLEKALIFFSNDAYSLFKAETGGRLAARLLREQTDKILASTPMVLPAESVVICSSFVSKVLRRASRYPFFSQLPVTVPADFIASGDFAPIPLAWKRIDH